MLQQFKTIRGAGGKGKASKQTNTNTPDNLRGEDTVEFIMGLSEGPIKGLTRGLKSLKVGDTQLEREDGGFNFEDFTVNVFLGEEDPDPVAFKLGGASTNRQVGVAIIQSSPLTRQTQSGQIDAIDVRIIVNSLYRQVTTGNNQGVFDETVTFRIKYRPLSSGTWTLFNGADINIVGKTTSPYPKEYRIPVERINEPYAIQVERVSQDSTPDGTYIADMTWESFQEIDQEPKTYPNTAILQAVGKATDQFTSVPPLSGEYDGMLVRLPVNYDPYARTYTGTWDGTWKFDWTNNPIWILYEAIHNDRWGWAAYQPLNWSKYEAYDLAQYCDHIIPEVNKPRYTFNAYLTEPLDGREFCRYIAGSCNSVITDDNNGNVHVLMDRNDAASHLIGPESIIGDLEYTYTDINTRYNDITVVFRNEETDYNEDRRRMIHEEQIERNGRIPFDFVAVGCTNENEALRKASRRLVAAATETEMVTFRTNRRGQFINPYDVILIGDPDRGQGYSGRFKSFGGTRSVVNLRDPIYFESGVSYQMDVQAADEIITVNVTGSVGWNTTLTLSEAMPLTVNEKAQFVLKQDGAGYGLPKPYRVLSVEEQNGNPDDWMVHCIEINRWKYQAEDDGEIVGEPDYSWPKTGDPPPPTNVTATNTSAPAADGTMIYRVRVDFTPPDDPYITKFEVRYQQEGEREFFYKDFKGGGEDIILPNGGDWVFEVRSRNVWQQVSAWVRANEGSPVTVDRGTAVQHGDIVYAIGQFQQVEIKVQFPSAPEVRLAQLWASQSSNRDTAAPIGEADSTLFIHGGLIGPPQTWYYWVKFKDTMGNVSAFSRLEGVMATTLSITDQDIAEDLIDDINDAIAGWQAANDRALEAIAKADALQLELEELAETTFPDIDGLMELILSNSVRYQAVRDYLEDLGYQNGIPLGTVITNEVNERIEGQNLIVEKIDLIGAATEDGEAFILNGSTVMVSPTQSFAQYIQSISTQFENTEAYFQSEITAVSEALEAEVTARTALAATVGANTAAITTEATVRANADAAEAALRVALAGRVDDAEAAIVNEASLRVAGDAAEAAARSTLATQVGANASAIVSEATSRANADTAISNELHLLGAKNGAGNAFILDLNTTRVGSTETLATRLSSIEARFNGTTTSYILETATATASQAATTANTLSLLGSKNGAGTAFVLDTSTTQIGSGETLGTRLSSIQTALGTNSAAITSETTARVNADTALATSITGVQTTANNASATAAFVLSSINGNEAKAVLALNAGGKITGFRAQASNQAFEILASRFTIVDDSNGSPIIPLIITGGVARMLDVEVGRLRRGSASDRAALTDARTVNIPMTSTWTTVATLKFESDGGQVTVDADCNFTAPNGVSTAAWGIWRDGLLLKSWDHRHIGSHDDSVTHWADDYTVSPGVHIYEFKCIYVYNDGGGANIVKKNASIRCEEWLA